MKPLAILAAILASAAYGAIPRAPQLPPEKPLPVETVQGYIVSEFNQWGQWNNQPKTFGLADDRVFRTNTDKLACPTRAVYLELERLDGQAVEVRIIRAQRESNEWLVVLSVEMLP